MYHGRYFRLDTDVANIEKGIAVFRYCPDGKADNGVYVTFSDNEIGFYFNSRVDDTIKNETILNIPIDDNIEQNFSKSVTGAFYSSIDGVFTIPPDDLPPSYHSTFRFGSNMKQVKSRKKPRTHRDIHVTPEPLLLRKLILDFLFDFKETHIFQMSSHYGKLSEKLRHNFFARCLVAKASYWYQRTLYENAVKEGCYASSATDRKAQKNKRQFYGEIFFQAEKEWADCIRDARSDKTFRDEFNGWFNDSEIEMQRIYVPHLPIMLKEGVTKKLKREHDINASQWFVVRHTGLTSWRILFGGNRAFFGIHLFWPRILFAVGTAYLTMSSMVTSHISLTPFFILLMLVMIFTASWIYIWRVIPLVRDTFLRALKLSCFALLLSLILGSVLWRPPEDQKDKFLFLWITAAFLGLVLHFLLQRGNTNDPL